LAASEAAAVIVVGRSHRIISGERRCAQVVESIEIDAFRSCDDRQGWWGCVVGERCGLVMGLSGKVTMVMMTLSAFLRRKARRFSTREFLEVLSVRAA